MSNTIQLLRYPKNKPDTKLFGITVPAYDRTRLLTAALPLK